MYRLCRHASTVMVASAALALFATQALAQSDDAKSAGPNIDIEVPGPNTFRPAVPQYWLGVQCQPLTPALRAQLDLPEGIGLVIEDVVADSPAASAGLRPFDVLLAAGERRLRGPEDLVQAVQASKGEAIKATFVRGGQRQTIEVRPTTAPAAPTRRGLPRERMGALRELLRDLPEAQRDGVLQSLLEEIGGEGQPLIRLFRPGPGVVLPPVFAARRPELPEDVSVTITREGRKPAAIVVKRGDETFEATEDGLDKLPEDVRQLVNPMLSGAMPFNIELRGDVLRTNPATPPPTTMRLRVPPDPQDMERRFEELARQMEDIRREVREMARQRRESRFEDRELRQEQREQRRGPPEARPPEREPLEPPAPRRPAPPASDRTDI